MEPDGKIFEALSRYTKALSVALGFRDLMTRLHSERVHNLSEMMAARCGLNEHEVIALRIGSMFHDIGKIGIPDHILMKPSRHDKAEWEIMKQHPVIGEEIMLSTGLEGSREAAIVIRHHHEHYDGGGYPDGLAGKAIPLCSQIIAITDSYDAMAVTRSYHQARSHREIMEILRTETGTKFDPQIMSLFCAGIENSPNKVA